MYSLDFHFIQEVNHGTNMSSLINRFLYYQTFFATISIFCLMKYKLIIEPYSFCLFFLPKETETVKVSPSQVFLKFFIPSSRPYNKLLSDVLISFSYTQTYSEKWNKFSDDNFATYDLFLGRGKH